MTNHRISLPSRKRTRKQVTAPGIYNIDQAFYHRDPCDKPSLSASIARKLLANQPIVAWLAHPKLNPQELEADDSGPADIGEVMHAMITGQTTRLSIIPYPDFRSETARQLRVRARREGRLPVLQKRHDELCEGVPIIMREIERCGLPGAIDPGATIYESTLVWRHAGSLLCRSRVDGLSRDIRDPMVVYDFKSTTMPVPSEAEDLGRRAVSEGWQIQGAAYADAVRSLFGVSRVEVFFILFDQRPPWTTAVLQLSSTMLEVGRRQWARAASIWAQNLTTVPAGQPWPRSPQQRVVIDAPTWLEMKWIGEVGNWNRVQEPKE